MQKINTARFALAEHARSIWQVTAEPGMTPESFLEPGVWANVAQQMKPFDTVTVLADDASWWAEYLVWDTDRLWAKVQLLRKVARTGASEDTPQRRDEYHVVYRGTRKYSVLRKSDNAVIKDGFSTKEDAQAHADALAEQLAA